MSERANPWHVVRPAPEFDRDAALNRDRLRTLFELNPDGMGLVDSAGVIVDINAAALAILGYSRDEMIGREFSEFVEAGDLARLWDAFQSSLCGEPRREEVCPRTKDGRHVDLECTGSPIVSNGSVVGVYVALTDISSRRRAERALQRQHERIRELYLCATTGNASGDEQIRQTLLLGCRTLGMEAASVFDIEAGTTVSVWADVGLTSECATTVIPEHLCRAAAGENEGLLLVAPDDALGTSGLGAFVGVPIDAGGRRFGALCFATKAPRTALEPGDFDLVHLMALLIRAEIERGQARVHLRSLAYLDALTNLPNRLMLKERLDEALAAATRGGLRCAALFLDLDRFKDVNDTLGHTVGDRLLQLAAERIVACVRSTETVARMGGDEFIVVMPAIHQASEAVALAERLLRAIAEPFAIAGSEQHATTSIGIAIAPEDGNDSTTLIKHADIAMYRAKERGRNTYVLFEPELDRAAAGQPPSEAGMRVALERGEFKTYFQPIIDIRRGRIYGVEALARWQHPALSLLRPNSFIASAESSGLIVRLGEVVLEDACRQVADWHRAGFSDLRLSVNLSGRQFGDPQLLSLISSVLQRTGFPRHLLELEISEDVATKHLDEAADIMRDLKAAGLRIVLDDFGTAEASLGHLRRLPLDAIKVDRSFVGGIGRDPGDEALVRAAIAMTRSLGLGSVAEGVETAEQVEFLRRADCERVQGHFYAPALAAQALERYLRTWSDMVDAGIAAGP